MEWDDTDEIAEALHEQYPDLNPLTLRLTDLRRFVCQLEEFEAEPDEGSEARG